MASSSSTLPWLWVTEALASFKQVDGSILVDFVEKTPAICDDMGKNISASNMRIDAPARLKWDVQTFNMGQGDCFPKCTLKQLKEAILEGNHPILASLKERSGLSLINESKNKHIVEDSDPYAVARRLGGNCRDGQRMAEGGNLDSLLPGYSDGLLPEYLPSINLIRSKRNRSDLDNENQAESSHEDCVSMENWCGRHLPKAKKLTHNSTSSFSEDCHGLYFETRRPGPTNVAQISCQNNKDTTGDGPHQDLPFNEAHDVAQKCGDKARDKCEKSELKTSNGAQIDESCLNNFPHVAHDVIDHNAGQGISGCSNDYNGKKIDVSMKKSTFSSGQCTFSEESLTMADCTEFNICIKCDTGGQLLACSTSTCPIVVHQSCLGSAPSIDDNGKFCCPYCAYSRAISKCLEVKRKASLARKDLAAFIGSDNRHSGDKLSNRILRPEPNQLTQEKNQANSSGNPVTEVNCSQDTENIQHKQQVDSTASCANDNLRSQAGAIVNDGRLGVSMESDRVRENRCPAIESASVLEGHQTAPLPGHGSSACVDCEIVHEKAIVLVTRLAEDGVQQGGSRQLIIDAPPLAFLPPNMDADSRSEEQNDQPTSYYPIACQRRESHRRESQRRENQYSYPAISHSRRKKVLWTAVEEEILKEGVKLFASDQERNMPWKKILEFGSHVFQKARTTIDLKDKWRNICKGSPKSN